MYVQNHESDAISAEIMWHVFRMQTVPLKGVGGGNR
jgi:hypothetical protein